MHVKLYYTSNMYSRQYRLVTLLLLLVFIVWWRMYSQKTSTYYHYTDKIRLIREAVFTPLSLLKPHHDSEINIGMIVLLSL